MVQTIRVNRSCISSRNHTHQISKYSNFLEYEVPLALKKKQKPIAQSQENEEQEKIGTKILCILCKILQDLQTVKALFCKLCNNIKLQTEIQNTIKFIKALWRQPAHTAFSKMYAQKMYLLFINLTQKSNSGSITCLQN